MFYRFQLQFIWVPFFQRLLRLFLKTFAKWPTQTKTHYGDQITSYENSKHNFCQSGVIVLQAMTFSPAPAMRRWGLSQDFGNANNNATKLY